MVPSSKTRQIAFGTYLLRTPHNLQSGMEHDEGYHGGCVFGERLEEQRDRAEGAVV